MLSTLILFLTLTVNAPAKLDAVSPASVQQSNTTNMLAKTWVLREQFHAHNGEKEPVRPHEKVELTFRENGTYTLNRHYGVAGAGSIEEGKWEFKAPEGYISLQTRQVDGGSILSTMMYRWEIIDVADDKLVLRHFSPSSLYLVLESKK